jgi:hypothetical protein
LQVVGDSITTAGRRGNALAAVGRHAGAERRRLVGRRAAVGWRAVRGRTVRRWFVGRRLIGRFFRRFFGRLVRGIFRRFIRWLVGRSVR